MEDPCALVVLSIFVGIVYAGGPCTTVNCRSGPPAQPISNATEQDTIRSIQCSLRCAQKYGLSRELSVSSKDWLLYSSALLNTLDCSTNQKLRECRRGCLQANSFQSSDECRDQCYASCQSECGGTLSCPVQVALPCDQQCRKPPCKQGCEEFNWTASLDLSLTPLGSPAVKINSSACGLYALNITGVLPVPSAVGEVVGVAINAAGCGKNFFLWQANVEDTLDLRSFACTTQSISFALVTRYTRSKWSLPLQLCVRAVQTIYPSQIPATSIKIRYYEDPRANFVGYAAADITWTPPPGFEYATSYTIQLLSLQYECGGSNVLYSFNNISKVLNEFIVQARTSNGLLKFGCNYYLIFITNPVAPGKSGTFIIAAPQLSNPPPQMEVVCQKVWDASGGFFNISLSISIVNATRSVLESISQFSITQELVQIRNNNFVPMLLEAYDTLTLQGQTTTDHYSLLLFGYKPKNGSQLFYKVQVAAMQNSAFFWRSVPLPQACYVDTSALPPAPILAFQVYAVQYSRVKAQAVLGWNPPVTANGVLAGYELCIGTNNGGVAQGQQYGACVLTMKTAVNQTSVSMIGSIPSTDESLCLYAQVRSFNEYLSSDWTPRALISNNPWCDGGSGLQPVGPEQFEYEATILIY